MTPQASPANEPQRLSAGSDSGGGGVAGVIELIREIKAGGLSPSSISVDDRVACVAYLSGEGFSVPEIAQILRVSDRTVMRDRARVREQTALESTPELLPQIAGRLVAEAEASIQRLRRIGRDKESPAAVRADAERAAWSVMRELTVSLQRLGYLPTAVVQVHADVTHRAGETPDFDEIQAELDRLDSIRSGCKAVNPEVDAQLGRARDALARASASDALKRAAKSLHSASAPPASTPTPSSTTTSVTSSAAPKPLQQGG